VPGLAGLAQGEEEKDVALAEEANENWGRKSSMNGTREMSRWKNRRIQHKLLRFGTR